MTITSQLHSFTARLSRRRRANRHPEALPHPYFDVPGRIDDPATAARVARSLCRDRWEDLTLALYIDSQHRLAGHAVVSTGWVQAALLGARPILAGAESCQASTVILVRYGRYRALSATEQEQRSFGSIAAACSRYGVRVADHLVVVG